MSALVFSFLVVDMTITAGPVAGNLRAPAHQFRTRISPVPGCLPCVCVAPVGGVPVACVNVGGWFGSFAALPQHRRLELLGFAVWSLHHAW